MYIYILKKQVKKKLVEYLRESHHWVIKSMSKKMIEYLRESCLFILRYLVYVYSLYDNESLTIVITDHLIILFITIF